MTKKYRLLKSISSPNCNVSAGVIGEMNEESGRVYFDNFRFYYEKETVEKNPDWFSEIKEWEIVTCYDENPHIIHNYISNNTDGESCKSMGCKIHSVRRNSDQQVFSIGDEVGYDNGNTRTKKDWAIDNFFIRESDGVLLARSKDNINVEIVDKWLYKNKPKEEQPFKWSDKLAWEFSSYSLQHKNDPRHYHEVMKDFKASKTNSIKEDSPEENAFNAARLFDKKDTQFKYKTFQDYKNTQP